MQDTNTATPVSCEPAQPKCTWTCHKQPAAWKFTRKMPDATAATAVLCEPAQSKCTCTCHKSHFVWKFAGKMLDASPVAGAALGDSL